MSDEPIDTPASGRLDGDRHLLPVRIYYEDTDFSGVVYHASYLRFLERGRTEFIRAVGIDQRAMHGETGIAFVVRAMTIEFLRPALMDDVVTIETKPDALRGPMMMLRQRILRAGAVLTSAGVTIVCVRNGRPLRVPESLRAAILGSRSPADGESPATNRRA
jgi:acyl-CoA thioester hydrolase